MINLLPSGVKQEIAFARRNTSLRKWVIATGIGLVGIALVIAAGQLFISRSTATMQHQVNSSKQSLEKQNLAQTQTRVAEMSDSIKLASQVLSKQILFSKLLAQITTVMPTGTSLESLSIKSVEGGIDLSAGAKDYQAATQVQVNLADSKNKIFQKADIIGINCDRTTIDYPCTVTIRALFSKENAFQYTSANAQETN